MKNDKNSAQVKCPKCDHETELDIPQSSCLPAYKCGNCSEIVTLPSDSTNCCVICEYSEKKCPISHKED